MKPKAKCSFGNEAEGKMLYAVRISAELADGEPGYASQCIGCEECLEKCPQELAIPDLMEEIAAEMEDDQLENRIAMARKMLNLE